MAKSIKFGSFDLDSFLESWQGSVRRRVNEQVIPRSDGVRIDLGRLSGYEVSVVGGLESSDAASLRTALEGLKEALFGQGKDKLRQFDDRYRQAQCVDLIVTNPAGSALAFADFEARFLAEEPYEIADALSTKQETIVEVLAESQESRNTSGALRNTSGQTFKKQGFVHGTSGPYSVVKVEVQLAKGGSPSGDVWVEIWGNNGSNEPDSSNKLSDESNAVKVSAASISASWGWISFSFVTPPNLTQGTTYHLVLAGDFTINGTDYLHVGMVTPENYRGVGSPYCDGRSADGSTWVLNTNHDETFRIYKGPEGSDAQAYTATTGGTAPVKPVIEVLASGSDLVDAVKLTNVTEGAFFAYHGTVAAGKTLIVDCGSQTAEIDGASVLADFEGDFFQLAKGGNSLKFEGDPCTVTLKWYDRWY